MAKRLALGLLAALFVAGGWRYVNFHKPVRPPVRIVQFFATTGAVEQGDRARLCYGVENARRVRISPLMDPVTPGATQCVEISPQHTTHYTLIAEGYDGSVVTRSLTLLVTVSPPPPPLYLHYVSMPGVQSHGSKTSLIHSRTSCVKVVISDRMRKNCDRPCSRG